MFDSTKTAKQTAWVEGGIEMDMRNSQEYKCLRAWSSGKVTCANSIEMNDSCTGV